MKQRFFLFLLQWVEAIERPVVFFHGANSNAAAGNVWKDWITNENPKATFIGLKSSEDGKSMRPMVEQSAELGEELLHVIKELAKPVTIVAHSQGCLLARDIVQRLNKKDDNGVPLVHTLILVSGPNAGVNGVGGLGTREVEKAVQSSAALKMVVDVVFYLVGGMDGLIDSLCRGRLATMVNMLSLPTGSSSKLPSICNFWRNPAYWEPDQTPWFSRMNNDLGTVDQDLKTHFRNLKKLVLVGSTADDAITPWQSSFFGFWADETQTKIEGMKESRWYKEDLFGLKTLEERGAIVICEQDGVDHKNTIRDEEIYEQCIRPHLD